LEVNVMHAAKLILQKDASLQNIETLHDNVYWAGAAPRISIAIPCYRYDCSDLIDALARCKQSSLAEIIVYDDGARDSALLAKLEENAGNARAAVRVVSAWTNRGPAAARNAAMTHARSEWVVFLDADMFPEGADFVEAWLDAADRLEEPAVVVGGQSLRFASKSRKLGLHRWHQLEEECLPAERRNQSAALHMSCSNVLVHKAVMDICPFDEAFTGWGWEDADWGLRVQRRFPVHHIDNTVTHLGLEDDRTLVGRYARGAANFARMVKRHPAEAAQMPLYRAAKACRSLPFRSGFRVMARLLARSPLLPLALRGRFLNAWRALVYAEAL
jgi:glycosyltransferase involved in cell wall biosynthesis